ncbi:hypothetical protein C7972_107155 [Arenibacter sp. ARW7G5Y1]|nr:hypothetical protein C7972_107155 [Arenibacter sp. ARW7G5Y1]
MDWELACSDAIPRFVIHTNLEIGSIIIFLIHSFQVLFLCISLIYNEAISLHINQCSIQDETICHICYKKKTPVGTTGLQIIGLRVNNNIYNREPMRLPIN